MTHVLQRYAGERAGLLAVLAVLLSSCRAGYHAPDSSAQLSYGSNIVEVGAVHWDLPARDLDRALGATDAGAILETSLEAHGGWDRWRSLTRIRYRRLRTRAPEAVVRSPWDGAPESSSDAPARLEVESEVRDVDFDPRDWGGARDEDASILSLPFLLLRGGHTQEYLGAEIDIAQEQEFHKIRFVRSQGGFLAGGEPWAAEEFVVYFDSMSGLVKQLLIRRETDEWLLFRMSGWETVGGLRLATRRTVFRLEKRFRRPRPEDLAWSDTLVDLDIR